MKVLFIGGTGNISTSVSHLAVERGIDLYLLNRGQRPTTIEGATVIRGDINNDVDAVREAIKDHYFDCVVNWIAFTQDQVERDIALFTGKCSQYIFISSASAYQKPLTFPIITEGTTMANPFWQYSRNKIVCEERLIRAYRDDGFPATIVRPSHTYDTIVPTAVGASNYLIPKRILEGKPVIIHGDGTTLWTLTHSADYAVGFVPLMGNPATIGHAFHITSDFVITWNQIYEQLGYALGVEPNVVHIPSRFIADFDFRTGEGILGDKMWCLLFDNSKIKSFVPEYVARIPFHIGIQRTLAWFQADEKRMQINPEQDQFIDNLLAAYQNR